MKNLDRKLASLKGEIKKLAKIEGELKNFSGNRSFEFLSGGKLQNIIRSQYHISIR